MLPASGTRNAKSSPTPFDVPTVQPKATNVTREQIEFEIERGHEIETTGALVEKQQHNGVVRYNKETTFITGSNEIVYTAKK